ASRLDEGFLDGVRGAHDVEEGGTGLARDHRQVRPADGNAEARVEGIDVAVRDQDLVGQVAGGTQLISVDAAHDVLVTAATVRQGDTEDGFLLARDVDAVDLAGTALVGGQAGLDGG